MRVVWDGRSRPMSDVELANWAGDVLRAIALREDSVDAVECLLELVTNRADWPRGRQLFVELRKRTLQAEEFDRDSKLDLLLLAENVAKTLYNLSGGPAPYDDDCATAVAIGAQRYVEDWDVPGLRDELAELLDFTQKAR